MTLAPIKLNTARIYPVQENSTDIQYVLWALRRKQTLYQTYADYYAGRHPLAFATSKFQNVFGKLFEAFADNLCPAVVDAVADRLQVTGFSTESGASGADPIDAAAGDATPAALAPEDQAWQIWNANRMDRRAGEVHLEALTSGDAYCEVWPDPTTRSPRIWTVPAHLATVVYDPDQPGRIAFGAKAWRRYDNTTRLNMYYPNRVEKYLAPGGYGTFFSQQQNDPNVPLMTPLPGAGAFQPYQEPGERWPLPNPWGIVPIFHFGNNARVGDFGVSELRNVVPLQDGLNKALMDLLAAMETVALPQRWATGIEPVVDPVTGVEMVRFRSGADSVWQVANELAKFGDFAPANLAPHLEVINDFRIEIARVSGTPLHYMALLTGRVPSGEALKALDERLTKKCKDRMVSFGNGWEDLMRLALLMDGGPDVLLSALWVDPAPVAELEHLQTLGLKQGLGVDDRTILTEMGYGESEVEGMLAEKAKAAAAMAKAMQSAPAPVGSDGKQPAGDQQQGGQP